MPILLVVWQDDQQTICRRWSDRQLRLRWDGARHFCKDSWVASLSYIRIGETDVAHFPTVWFRAMGLNASVREWGEG